MDELEKSLKRERSVYAKLEKDKELSAQSLQRRIRELEQELELQKKVVAAKSAYAKLAESKKANDRELKGRIVELERELEKIRIENSKHERPNGADK